MQLGFTYARPADAYRRAGEAYFSKNELQLNAPTHLQQEGWHMRTRRERHVPQQNAMKFCNLRLMQTRALTGCAGLRHKQQQRGHATDAGAHL